MKCDFCKLEKRAISLHGNYKLCYGCNISLKMAAPELLEGLLELLTARNMQHRVGLWPTRFPHMLTSSVEPKSWARKRFEFWFTHATCKVIKAEEQACAAIAKAKGETK